MKKNIKESYKDEDSEKVEKIENLEKPVNENEERLNRYEEDLIDLASQIESKDNKIRSLEGRNFESQDEKANSLSKENKARIDDCNVQISLLHQDSKGSI